MKKEEHINNNNDITKTTKVDYIYLMILLLFFIITIILFFISTNFIVSNINKIFAQSEVQINSTLNTKSYSIVEKKLNLPKNDITENITNKRELNEEQITILQPESETQTNKLTPTKEESLATTEKDLDKKSLIMHILNGSRKPGVASDMAVELEKAGFLKGTTGDTKNIYPITTILIKNSKKEYTKVLEEAVKKNHPKTITKVNPEKSKFDVIVIVGKE